MPTPLRHDDTHPLTVAHASMHQAAANALASGWPELAQEILTIAEAIFAMIAKFKNPPPPTQGPAK